MISKPELDRLGRSVRTIESIAVLNRVGSTNALGRRIIDECVENEIEIPPSVIVAAEQTEGRGRATRSWHSPPHRGIYVTALMRVPMPELQFLPLHAAVIVTRFLREVFSVDAHIKWPNDVLAEGRKMAGILIEARNAEEYAYTCIGIGINVEPVGEIEGATSISEASPIERIDLEATTIAFIEHLDASLGSLLPVGDMLEEWKRLAVHKPGDRIASVVGDRRIEGSWQGIDETGRAIIRRGEETMLISAGDLILLTDGD